MKTKQCATALMNLAIRRAFVVSVSSIIVKWGNSQLASSRKRSKRLMTDQLLVL
jgi:hypothetical protein